MRNMNPLRSKLPRQTLARRSEGKLPARKRSRRRRATDGRRSTGYDQRGRVLGGRHSVQETRQRSLGEEKEPLSVGSRKLQLS